MWTAKTLDGRLLTAHSTERMTVKVIISTKQGIEVEMYAEEAIDLIRAIADALPAPEQQRIVVHHGS